MDKKKACSRSLNVLATEDLKTSNGCSACWIIAVDLRQSATVTK